MPEPTTSSEGSRIRIGTGVKRKAEEEKPAVVTDTGIKEVLDDKGRAKWAEECSILDQFIKHPKTCRKLPPQVKLFRLDNAEELEEFNKLLASSHPPGNPKIVMHTQEQAFEGTWSVLVRFQKIEYKILISTK